MNRSRILGVMHVNRSGGIIRAYNVVRYYNAVTLAGALYDYIPTPIYKIRELFEVFMTHEGFINNSIEQYLST